MADIDETIDLIAAIRSDNNYCWMELLKLAYKRAPKEAREIMKDIQKNDRRITKCLGKL